MLRPPLDLPEFVPVVVEDLPVLVGAGVAEVAPEPPAVLVTEVTAVVSVLSAAEAEEPRTAEPEVPAAADREFPLCWLSTLAASALVAALFPVWVLLLIRPLVTLWTVGWGIVPPAFPEPPPVPEPPAVLPGWLLPPAVFGPAVMDPVAPPPVGVIALAAAAGPLTGVVEDIGTPLEGVAFCGVLSTETGVGVAPPAPAAGAEPAVAAPATDAPVVRAAMGVAVIASDVVVDPPTG